MELYEYFLLMMGVSAGTPLRQPTIDCHVPFLYASRYSFHLEASASFISTTFCVAASYLPGMQNSPKMRTLSGLVADCQKKPVGAMVRASFIFHAYPRGDDAKARST